MGCHLLGPWGSSRDLKGLVTRVQDVLLVQKLVHNSNSLLPFLPRDHHIVVYDYGVASS